MSDPCTISGSFYFPPPYNQWSSSEQADAIASQLAKHVDEKRCEAATQGQDAMRPISDTPKPMITNAGKLAAIIHERFKSEPWYERTEFDMRQIVVFINDDKFLSAFIILDMDIIEAMMLNGIKGITRCIVRAK
jgi:hypothetical protein